MADPDPKRQKEQFRRDIILVFMGVVLGVLAQSLYDILKADYVQYYPKLPVQWVDGLAAVALTIILILLFSFALWRFDRRPK